MSYKIDYSDQANYGSITVADQSINQETSLSFVGKNYTGYAKSLAENSANGNGKGINTLFLPINFNNFSNPFLFLPWFNSINTNVGSKSLSLNFLINFFFEIFNAI